MIDELKVNNRRLFEKCDKLDVALIDREAMINVLKRQLGNGSSETIVADREDMINDHKLRTALRASQSRRDSLILAASTNGSQQMMQQHQRSLSSCMSSGDMINAHNWRQSRQSMFTDSAAYSTAQPYAVVPRQWDVGGSQSVMIRPNSMIMSAAPQQPVPMPIHDRLSALTRQQRRSHSSDGQAFMRTHALNGGCCR